MADADMLDLDIDEQAGDWAAIADARGLADRAARAAFAAAADTSRDTEAALLLTDDAAVQALNRDYRGQDKPTNVLSFAALDDDMPTPDDAPLLLGDIIVAFETVMAEAARDAKTPADHFSHLVVHGMLHLLGFDHDDETQAETMEALEVKILSRLGIADPYGEARGRD